MINMKPQQQKEEKRKLKGFLSSVGRREKSEKRPLKSEAY